MPELPDGAENGCSEEGAERPGGGLAAVGGGAAAVGGRAAVGKAAGGGAVPAGGMPREAAAGGGETAVRGAAAVGGRPVSGGAAGGGAVPARGTPREAAAGGGETAVRGAAAVGGGAVGGGAAGGGAVPARGTPREAAAGGGETAVRGAAAVGGRAVSGRAVSGGAASGGAAEASGAPGGSVPAVSAPGGGAASGGPLAGVRVLDLTSVVMGPLATAILGDLGADVVTVESARGDTNRAMGAGPHPYLSGVSLNLLRNKRNIDLDLKSAEGRAILLRLAARCDVFVTNLRPGPLARLGAAYEDVAAVRPDVIYCRAHGWAADSPRGAEAAYDDIVQAASGVADLARRVSGTPGLMPTIFADKVSGLTIVYAVLAALLHRERTGEGQQIEIPMADTVSAFLLVEHGAAAIPQPPVGPVGYQRILTPERRPQQTADGWIAVLPYSREHYDLLFAIGGRRDLIGDPRYADGRSRIEHSDFLYRQVRGILRHRTTAEWLELLHRHGIPASPVATLDELVGALPVADHPVAGRYRVIPPPVRFSRTPASVRRPAPLPGEHNAEVLAELGLTAAEIAQLQHEGVLRSRPRRPQEGTGTTPARQFEPGTGAD